MITFSWDPAKARINRKKHGVSFEEAKSDFYDEFAVQFYDNQSSHEDRYLLLGLSNQSRILIVVHCEIQEGGEELRIISARKATNRERQYYQGDPL